LILATIGRLGVSGMVGHAVEYAGETIRGLSMENRMTICNMTIEGGGRAGMIAPDEITYEWSESRPGAPEDFETEVEIDGSAISPMVTWGTNPGMVTQVTGSVPDPTEWGEGPADREAA